MADIPTFGHYAEIPYDQMTPEQQEGYHFLKEVRGQVGGPSKIWVHNPKLVKAAAPLGAHFHPGHYSPTEREREIAVCIINAKWHSAYPTSAHERRGKEVGLPADKVEALLAGLQTSFSDEREQVVYEMIAATGRPSRNRRSGPRRFWLSSKVIEPKSGQHNGRIGHAARFSVRVVP
jgi:4-carboxymuconolactone decarboxylase